MCNRKTREIFLNDAFIIPKIYQIDYIILGTEIGVQVIPGSKSSWQKRFYNQPILCIQPKQQPPSASSILSQYITGAAAAPPMSSKAPKRKR
jgi:hypothetical protein